MRPPRGRRKRRWLFLASTKQDWASILVFLLTDDQPGTGADAHPDADEMSSSLPYPPSGRLSVCHRAPSMKTDKLLPLQRHKDAPSPGPPPSLAAGSMVRPSSVSPRDSSAALPPLIRPTDPTRSSPSTQGASRRVSRPNIAAWTCWPPSSLLSSGCAADRPLGRVRTELGGMITAGFVGRLPDPCLWAYSLGAVCSIRQTLSRSGLELSKYSLVSSRLRAISFLFCRL